MSDTGESLETIAIIGMAGRFPGAKDVSQFWQNLRNGVESISRFTDEELESHGIQPEEFNSPNYVKAGSVIHDAEMFDASFFGISPRDAEIINPQHRLFLELAWTALENSGYDPETYHGAIGVFAGTGINDHWLALKSRQSPHDAVGAYQNMIGNDKDFLSTRISYQLNLKGPSLTIQTACSTSLVAVQIACQSLLNYQCDMALSGAVCVDLPQRRGYFHEEGMIFSPDGHCRAFDAQARGTVIGNGLGIVVLKRLSEAIDDGDTIHAVIKGAAINNDGSAKVGYTAPSVDGQAEVITTAQALAQVDPETIGYIEAHGTGTLVGDPIEIEALTQAFRAGTQMKEFCAIGSVKTNIGHLDVAAGVAGLIKTILILKHGEVPPSLHFETANPEIDFANSPFYVNTQLKELPRNGAPRRAGVSSFGIGGSNAHVVLEEAPTPKASGGSRPQQLLVLSAKTKKALDAAQRNLAEHLKQCPELNLADVAYTLHCGRRPLDHRWKAVCEDMNEALAALEGPNQNRVSTSFVESTSQDVVFLFPGQGSQYVNMGKQLYDKETIFREQIDRCSELLEPQLSLDIRKILYPNEEDCETAAERLGQTNITQPALFAFEYALAQLWMSWGVRPATFVGHSVAEYVAACLAGVFSLEDALSLVATRGRLVAGLPRGSMLALPLPEAEVTSLLDDGKLSLAVVNGPSSCVVSGETADIEDLKERLSFQNVDSQILHTSHAFHSEMMDPILETFAQHVRGVDLGSAQIPIVSTVTGTGISADEMTSPTYWVNNLRNTVRYSECVNELLKDKKNVYLEIGPGRTLGTLLRQHANPASGQIVLSSIRHPKEESSDVAFILNALGDLCLAGVQPDWSTFYANEQRRRIPLPTQPFERQRFRVESFERAPSPAIGSPGTRIVELLQKGEVGLLADELSKSEAFSKREAALLPKLLGALAEQHQQQLKTSRNSDQASSQSHQFAQAPSASLSLPCPREISEPLWSQLNHMMSQPEVDFYPELLIQLEALSADYVWIALGEMGWKGEMGKRYSSDDLAKQLGVVPKLRRLFARLLEILSEEQVLRQAGSEWELIALPESVDPLEQVNSLLHQYPTAEAELRLLETGGSHLAKVLLGECDSLQLLFPDADLSTLTRYYTNSPALRGMNKLVREAVVTSLEGPPRDAQIRILEIGAGTGGTTAEILPGLKSHHVEYVFTDVSSVFTNAARKTFADYPFVRYEILDIADDPMSQGFDPHQFDVIIASNVLHATEDVRLTVQRVKQLLASRGILLLLETTERQRWLDVVFGALEGWWKFSDADLRASSHLLSASQWIQLLSESGFVEVAAVDSGQVKRGGLLQQSVVIAQGEEIKSEMSNEQTGERVDQVPVSSEAPNTPTQKAIAGIWRELLGIDQVGIHDNYFALGGDSLQAIKVISSIKQVFGKTLPSKALFQAPTIEQLAEALQEEAPSRAGTSAVSLQPNGSKPPFFFFAGKSHFGDRLGPDQPVYRVVYQDLDREQPLVRVEDMAAHSIKSVKTIQPDGPYYLGGHGLGGLVAFETARQLQRHGEKVAMLALCEAPLPGSRPSKPGTSAYRLWQRANYYFHRARRVGARQALANLLGSLKTKTQRAVWRRQDGPRARSRQGYRAAAHDALREYVPQVYSGRITFVICTERVPWKNDDILNGWGGLATDGVQAYEIPGSHTGIYRELNVGMLARTLNDVLHKAQARAEGERMALADPSVSAEPITSDNGDDLEEMAL